MTLHLARWLAHAGVPTVPGTNKALENAELALEFAKSAGYPVILKAAMGGGGRGMRVVRREEEMRDAFLRASNEAKSAFGDGRMFIEKFIEGPRHIEVQVVGDGQGNVVHFYERDCSVQRRHQKVVEIAPAPDLNPEVRQAILDSAVKIARYTNYKNVGTVEFMVDKNGDHYFLEVREVADERGSDEGLRWTGMEGRTGWRRTERAGVAISRGVREGRVGSLAAGQSPHPGGAHGDGGGHGHRHRADADSHRQRHVPRGDGVQVPGAVPRSSPRSSCSYSTVGPSARRGSGSM